MKKRQYRVILAFFTVLLATLNSLALYFRIYWIIPWSDMPMHFLGGVVSALFALNILFLFRDPLTFSVKKLFAIFLAITLIIGASWEIFELLIKMTFTYKDNYFSDTVSDILFDLLGGIIFTICFLLRERLYNSD